ncbi:MAG: hypothetical protein KKA42_00285, partial [candidate division Zixibacteria bacterium]|nr:hypothetical protein [candidate division Zixibacteria bacterium]
MKTAGMFISIATSVLMCFAPALSAADLVNLYRSGELHLTVDKSFAADEVSFGDSDACTDIAVADDGSVFAATCDGWSICKFSPTGKLLATIGEKGSGEGQFRNRPSLGGILDNRYVFTTESNGRITVFDVSGRYVKTIALDYMPLQAVALQDGNIAVVGHVAYSGKRVRNIAVVINIQSEAETIVASRIEDNPAGTVVEVKAPGDRGTIAIGSPFGNPRMVIAATGDGNLVVGFGDQDYLRVLDPSGVELGRFSLDIKPLRITQTERDEYAASIRETLRKMDLPLEAADAVKR